MISMTNSTNNSSLASSNGNLSADIQAQLELLVELRKFINIDLHQRGYYQIRLQLKCLNKQMPIKIMLQLEKNPNNVNLSDSMYPSCVIDDYAVSKTFLILYRNEEIILDDQVLFKISTIVNAYNLIDSFEKMDLQLNVELWFTENDYKAVDEATSSISGQTKDSSTTNASTASFTSTNSSSTTNPVPQQNTVQFATITNSSSSLNSSSNNTASNGGNGMQMLNSRSLKIRFDPRQGVHLQLPVLFDYYFLSSVQCTIHCTLLTLLPPVMLGTSQQRNSTLTTILFGKDLSKFKCQADVGDSTMKRAVYLHNQICGLLLASYENLQDHIIKMSAHLNEYKLKKLDLEYVDCQVKLQKISGIANECSDAESLDDIANRHVAQCSAENIMQWCTYMETFSLSQEIAPQLALEYHKQRLKRFSENFFIREHAKKNLNEYDINENYTSLNEIIRQSAYCSQLPSLSVSCEEMDGTALTMPIVFEDSYVSSFSDFFSTADSISSSNFSSNESFNKLGSEKKNEKNPFVRSFNSSFKKNSSAPVSGELASGSNQYRKNSLSSNENGSANSQLSDSSKQLQRKFRKKFSNNSDPVDQSEKGGTIQLVSYRKMNTEFDSDNPLVSDLNSNPSSQGSLSSCTSETNSTQSKLSQIKAELSMRGSTPSMNRIQNLHSITEGHPTTEPNKRRSLVKQQTQLEFKGQKSIDSSEDIESDTCRSLTNLTNTNNIFSSDFVKKNENIVSKDQEDTKCDVTIELENIEMIAKPSTTTIKATTENNTDLTNKDEKREESKPNITNKLLNNLISEGINSSNNGPVDCSFKSRALYESFRGKPSTLERPRQKKQLNNQLSVDQTGKFFSTQNTPGKQQINKRISYDDLNDSIGMSLQEESCRVVVKALSSEQTSFNSDSKNKKSPLVRQLTINTDKNSLSSVINKSVYKFALSKEDLKRAISFKYTGHIYSEFSSLFCTGPYFYSELTPKMLNPTSNNMFDRKLSHRSSFISTISSSKNKMLKLFKTMQQEDSVDSQSVKSDDIDESIYDDERLHLVVCVHGLDGNPGDLRVIRSYLEMALPGAKLEFLMSEQNQDTTYNGLEVMAKGLIKEINDYIDIFGIDPERISFIGHSLGNLIIRSTVAHEDFKPFIGKLYTYMSLSAPHLGTLYNSNLINMGMWMLQKWTKSESILQLGLKDHPDLQKTFLYKLSTKPTFEYFKNILLVASPQDRYVPLHSARLEMCKAALKDSMYGSIYREMVANILRPIRANPNIVFKRYTAFHCLPSGTDTFIGRAAHLANLDSELFVEKLILVSAAKYFR